MNVIIPSYKRADGLTGKDYFTMAKYCVPESQADDYMKALGGSKRIITLPDDQDGNISRKRNWILKNIERPLIMMDDDVRRLVYWDKRDEQYLSRPVLKEDVDFLFHEWVDLAEQFGVKLFGLAQNKDDRSFKEFLPFNLSRIILGPFSGHLEHPLLYDESVGLTEDYDICLQHLNEYKKVLRINKFAYDCDHRTNSGGVVSFRTLDFEVKSCKAIMLKWGKSIIQYRIPPKKHTDVLNAKKVNVPINGI